MLIIPTSTVNLENSVNYVKAFDTVSVVQTLYIAAALLLSTWGTLTIGTIINCTLNFLTNSFFKTLIKSIM